MVIDLREFFSANILIMDSVRRIYLDEFGSDIVYSKSST